MLKKPTFWLIQVLALSLGGIMASAGFPKGDYAFPIFFGLAISSGLTIILSLEK